MGYKHYLISDAAKRLDVEPHVLRYWEEELELGILRNEMGHRYYREEDLARMNGVKQMRDNGFSLKAIKLLLPEMDKVLTLEKERLLEMRDRLELAVSQEELRRQREEELAKGEPHEPESVKKVPEELTGEKESIPEVTKPVLQNTRKASEMVTVSDEEEEAARNRMLQFRSLMNEIISDAIQDNNQKLTTSITDSVSREIEYQMRRKEMLAEEHFKQLDRTLRECQLGQKQAAVARECSGRKRKSKFFRKHRRERL